MSPKVAMAVIVIALVLALGAWWQWGPSSDTTSDVVASDKGAQAAQEIDQDDLGPATLYWLGSDARLHGIERLLPMGDATSRVTSLVSALLEEPEAGMQSPLPAGTELASVFFLTPTSVALNFKLPADIDLGRVGSTQELLSIYSLVNTVAMNVAEVESVVLLIDGQQPKTLAGHVDTTHPLGADPSLVAG